MSVPAFRVVLDHAQERLGRGLLTMLAQGSWPGVGDKRAAGWDLAVSSSDVYVDPVTYTLMLRPSSLRPEFYETNSGVYAKLGVSDFTGLTTSAWEENDKTGIGGSKFLRAQGVSESGLTVASYPANTAFSVAWFPHGEGGEHEALRFGWNSSASYLGGVALRVWSTGRVVVYKGGLVVGEHNVGGGSSERKDLNRWVQLTCIPCRKRALLVLSDTGEGFSQLFDDLDEQADDPEVLPPGRFWFHAPSPAVADVQVHRVRFPASGTAYSVLGRFAEPPEPDQGAPQFRVYGHKTASVAASLVTEALAPFSADGAQQAARLRAVLSGDTFTTPSVYGVLAQYEGTLEPTAADEHDVTNYVVGLSFSASESPSSTEASVTLARLDALEAETGMTELRWQHGRPCRIEAGGVALFDGQAERLEVEEGLAGDDALLTFTVRDPWGPLERLLYRDPLPLDGVPLANAIRTFATAAGFPTAMAEVEDPDYTIPADGSPTSGEWGTLVEVGDSPADWLQRVMEAYAADWFYRFVPEADGVRFRAMPPESLPSSPSLTLWPDRDSAFGEMLGEGVAPESAALQANARVYRSLRMSVVPCEATEVRVTGIEPRTGQPAYQAYSVDDDAEEVGAAPSARPRNWRGEKIVYGYADTLLTSQAAVERALSYLYRRLTAARVVAEWQGDMLFKPDGAPVWPGDLVRLEGSGAFLPASFRVLSFSASVVKDPDGEGGYGDWAWRPASYTAELVESSGQPWHGRARRPGLDHLRAESEAAASPERRRAVRAAVAMLKRGAILREKA